MWDEEAMDDLDLGSRQQGQHGLGLRTGGVGDEDMRYERRMEGVGIIAITGPR